jgi:hypothetical protein
VTRFRVSRSAWLLLLISLLFAAAAMSLARIYPLPQPNPEAVGALRNERVRLAANSDEALTQLRDEAAASRAPRLDAGEFLASLKALEKGWIAELRTSEATRDVRISRSSVPLAEWVGVRGALHRWSQMQGVRLTSLDVQARGRDRGRQFERIEIGLSMPFAAPGNEPGRAGPGPGAPRLATAMAATPREVGPGPPLLPARASAEPPASGQGSAAVRPDHPGSASRASSPTLSSIKP